MNIYYRSFHENFTDDNKFFSSSFFQKSRKFSMANPLLSKATGKTLRATRAIRKLEPEFDPKEFAADIAQQIYIDAHKCLAE